VRKADADNLYFDLGSKSGESGKASWQELWGRRPGPDRDHLVNKWQTVLMPAISGGLLNREVRNLPEPPTLSQMSRKLASKQSWWLRTAVTHQADPRRGRSCLGKRVSP
jgi:hypothetical protein